MRFDPQDLGPAALAFFSERHLATLSLVLPEGDLHVTPVGFTWDNDTGIARVITFAASKKVRLIQEFGPLRAALGQVDGGRWATLHGQATVSAEPSVCADAVRRYGERYRTPKDRGDDRRVIEMVTDKIIGRIPD